MVGLPKCVKNGAGDRGRTGDVWESGPPFDINHITAQVFGSGASNTL
jgi:hypothetical protein